MSDFAILIFSLSTKLQSAMHSRTGLPSEDGSNECTTSMLYGKQYGCCRGPFSTPPLSLRSTTGQAGGQPPDWTSRFVSRGRLGVNELIVMMKPDVATESEREF